MEIKTRICKECNVTQDIKNFTPVKGGTYRGHTCYSCKAKKAAKNPVSLLHKMADGAKRRCTDPNNVSYVYYGAKGIEYKLDKQKFIKDHKDDVVVLLNLGKTPSIDRIDPSKGYTNDNVQIIPLRENSAKGSFNAMVSAKKKRDSIKNLVCSQCEIQKPFTEVYFPLVGGKHLADGSPALRKVCRDCDNARRREKGRQYRKNENRDMENRNAKRRARHQWRMENDPEYRNRKQERNRRAQQKRNKT